MAFIVQMVSYLRSVSSVQNGDSDGPALSLHSADTIPESSYRSIVNGHIHLGAILRSYFPGAFVMFLFY